MEPCNTGVTGTNAFAILHIPSILFPFCLCLRVCVAARWFAHDWLAVSTAEEGVHIFSAVLGAVELGLKVGTIAIRELHQIFLSSKFVYNVCRAVLIVCFQALILAMLLAPGITANTAEITKRWGGSNGLIRLEMPQAEPTPLLERPVGGDPFSRGPGVTFGG